MRYLLSSVCVFVCMQTAFAQNTPTPPAPLQVTRYYSITASSTLDGAGYIDNRSTATRRNNYHSFRATGTGTWTVTLQYADGVPSGWQSFGSEGVVTNASPASGVGYGLGYHDYIKFAFSGTATVANYFGTKDAWWIPTVSSVVYPITDTQGGTGLNVGIVTFDQLPAYSTLQQAVTAAGSGTLICTTTWTLTAQVVVAAGLRIQGTPSCIIKAGANSINILSFSSTSDGSSVEGVTFDANSHTGIKGIQTQGVDRFSATYNTFIGAASMEGIDINSNGGTPSTTTYLAHNTFTGISFGMVAWEADDIKIEFNTGTSLTGNLAAIHETLNSFTNGATLTYQNNTNLLNGRIGMEIAGNGFRWWDISHNVTTMSVSAPCISGGSDLFGGMSDQLTGYVVNDNSCVSLSSIAVDGEFAYELYGHNGTFSGNSAVGHGFNIGLLYDGYNNSINNFHCENLGQSSANNTSFCVSPNTGGMQNPEHDNTIYSIHCKGVQSGCVGGGRGGDIIRDIHDQRAPGHFSTDSSQIYQSVQLGTPASPYLNPQRVEGAITEILPPENAYTLPGTMVFLCFSNFSGNGQVTYQNNSCTNQNATAFGSAYYTSGSNFSNTKLIGGKFTNLADIGDTYVSLSSTTALFSGNQVFAGLGSTPTPSYSINSSNINVNLILYPAETGADNAIAGTLFNPPALYNGLTICVQLAHALQAGANTFNFNGGGAVAIKSSRSPGANIGTAYALSGGGGGTVCLMYQSYFPEWIDLSQ